MPYGWGILIVEGLNRRLAAKIMWISLIAVFSGGTIWSILAQKGVGVGPLAMAVTSLIASFMTSKYYDQIER